MNTQNYSFSQSQSIPKPTLNSVSFNDQPRSSQDQSENYPVFHQKNNTNRYITRNQPPYYTANYFPSDDREYYNQNHQQFYLSQRPRSYSIDQPDIFEPYTRDEQIRQRNIIQYHTIIFFNQKTQSIHNLTNQLKCLTKSHCHILYNNMNLQKVNLQNFLKYQMPQNHYK